MPDAPTITIRDATTRDAEPVVALTLAAYEQFTETLSAAWWASYQLRVVEKVRGDLAACGIVAEYEGTLAGSVLLYPGPEHDSSTPEINLLAVAPSMRGHGIASALVRECLRRARAAGAPAIGLHTTEAMVVARAMYERMGFVRAPETDIHPIPDVLVLGYRLDLT